MEVIQVEYWDSESGPSIMRKHVRSCKESYDGAGIKEGFSGSSRCWAERRLLEGSWGKPVLASGVEVAGLPWGRRVSLQHHRGTLGCHQGGIRTALPKVSAQRQGAVLCAVTSTGTSWECITYL